MIMLPVILILVAAVMLFGSLGNSLSNVFNGGSVQYDERTMQTYGNEQYAKAFANAEAYEENLLITFLINDERDGYYVYACVGDDMDVDVKELFGNENTRFGATVLRTVNSEYYEYSLSSNLADVMTKMADDVVSVSDEAVGEGTDTSRSVLINNSSLTMNEATVNKSLKKFTEKTGIEAAIVVEDMEEVFGKTLATGDIVTVIIAVAIIALAIYLIYKAVRSRKQGDNGGYN